MARKFVRIECCATREIADTRRGFLETNGFTVEIEEDARAVKMQPKTPDDLEDDYIFGRMPCAFLLIARN